VQSILQWRCVPSSSCFCKSGSFVPVEMCWWVEYINVEIGNESQVLQCRLELSHSMLLWGQDTSHTCFCEDEVWVIHITAKTGLESWYYGHEWVIQDYEIGIYYFSTRLAALRRKSKNWLALNHDNVSEWGDMTIRRLFLQWASTIKIHLSVLV
jgi:hypothetical protein